jgi:hypothetical protein
MSLSPQIRQAGAALPIESVSAVDGSKEASEEGYRIVRTWPSGYRKTLSCGLKPPLTRVNLQPVIVLSHHFSRAQLNSDAAFKVATSLQCKLHTSRGQRKDILGFQVCR